MDSLNPRETKRPPKLTNLKDYLLGPFALSRIHSVHSSLPQSQELDLVTNWHQNTASQASTATHLHAIQEPAGGLKIFFTLA